MEALAIIEEGRQLLRSESFDAARDQLRLAIASLKSSGAPNLEQLSPELWQLWGMANYHLARVCACEQSHSGSTVRQFEEAVAALGEAERAYTAGASAYAADNELAATLRQQARDAAQLRTRLDACLEAAVESLPPEESGRRRPSAAETAAAYPSVAMQLEAIVADGGADVWARMRQVVAKLDFRCFENTFFTEIDGMSEDKLREQLALHGLSPGLLAALRNEPLQMQSAMHLAHRVICEVNAQAEDDTTQLIDEDEALPIALPSCACCGEDAAPHYCSLRGRL